MGACWVFGFCLNSHKNTQNGTIQKLKTTLKYNIIIVEGCKVDGLIIPRQKNTAVEQPVVSTRRTQNGKG
jgi:hypothetical protein